MARPKKTGLDFYYKDVHEMDDYRIMDLMDKYGAVGYVVLDMAMSCIYRNGYYLEIPINRLAAYIRRYIAGSCPQTGKDIAEIITYCGELGIFDRELLSRSVLTSREIQEHYSCVSARRKADRSRYWLLPETTDKPSEERPSPAETDIPAAEITMNVTETDINAAETDINAAETRINAAETKINAAIIPQSKANKSKANESKANETKPNESKANQSKANQSKHVSADEIFCDPAYAFADAFADADADAGAENASDDGFSAADADSAGYGEIEKAYYAAVGKSLNDTDRADIDTIRGEGADDRLILNAVNRVASRRQKIKINSFRYFLPMIRDMLRKTDGQTYAPVKPAAHPRGDFIHNDTQYDDPYAGCVTTEEYLAALDREFSCARAW